MEHPRGKNDSVDHVIDIRESGEVSSSGSSGENPPRLPHQGDTRTRNDQATVVQASLSSSGGLNRSSPSVYKVLTSIKLTYKLSLIITSALVLAVSRHEKPQNPLFAWILGYIIGCAASIPVIFRHYFLPHPRLCRLVDRYDWLLEFFFALWFVIGNYWVFGEKSSSEARNLYRGILHRIGGAPTESIEALPTYKFKLQRHGSGNNRDTDEKMHGCGVVAEGTEKERVLIGEDAVCCICLASYDDNEELKELPCSHLFHSGCVDTWLKIKGFCPLCKYLVRKGNGETPAGANPNLELMEQEQQNQGLDHHVIDMPGDVVVSGSRVSSQGSDANQRNTGRVVEDDRSPLVLSPFSYKYGNGVVAKTLDQLLVFIVSTHRTAMVIASAIVLHDYERHNFPSGEVYTWVLCYQAIYALSLICIALCLLFPARGRLLVPFLSLELSLFVLYVAGIVWSAKPAYSKSMDRLSVAYLVFGCIKYLAITTVTLCDIEIRKRDRGGIVTAAGSKIKRANLQEDECNDPPFNMAQECCICLESYEENEELKELHCSHSFHPACVDKWLKIRPYCPVCKSMVPLSATGSRANIQITL
ncbi:hypothetical protein Tsubulata_009698 [Turnera subulata]|uniref:RING-type domain-containing protein n=1 Tax=Turnera subulata TaxID=218843 RepID=A0A9Q0FVW3_9ROSI|nr:hypothetical protein Tsubulata_009698 [Turnera subulata]